MKSHPNAHGWKEGILLHIQILFQSFLEATGSSTHLQRLQILNRTDWPPSPHLQYYCTTPLIWQKQEISQMCNTFCVVEIFPYLYQLVAESGARGGLTLRRVVLYGYSDDWVKGLQYIQASCGTVTRNQSKKKINAEISCLIWRLL